MRKIILSLSLFALIGLTLFSDFGFTEVRVNENILNQEIIKIVDKKEYCNATIEDNFVSDSVIVVMDKKTGGVNKKHNLDFF